MSKTINQRVKELQEREERLKHQLSADSDVLKSKTKRIGKIALISGLATLFGYWIYHTFFSEEQDNEKPKKKRKKRNDNSGFLDRIFTVTAPYITQFLEEMLDLKKLEEDTPKDEEQNP